MAEIRIRGEPTADQQVCRFVVDRRLHGGNASFPSAAAAEGAPLAEALFALPDVSAVTIARDTVSVTKQGDGAWPEIGKLIGDAIRAQIASGEPAAPTFRDALETQKVCDAVLASASSGNWVDIG